MEQNITVFNATFIEEEIRQRILNNIGSDRVRVEIVGCLEKCSAISEKFIFSIDTTDMYLTVSCYAKSCQFFNLYDGDPVFVKNWFRIRARRGTSVYDIIPAVASVFTQYAECHQKEFNC